MHSSCHAQLVCCSRVGYGGLLSGHGAGEQAQCPHAISTGKGRSPCRGQLSHSVFCPGPVKCLPSIDKWPLLLLILQGVTSAFRWDLRP